MEKTVMTKGRYEELEKELKFLKTQKMAEIEDDIQEARGHGDLSENAEYDAAKDAQGQTHARIMEIEHMLENAEIIDESAIDTSSVNLGVIVTLQNTQTNEKLKVKVVGEADAAIDTEPMRISNMSPIGAAILGHKKGDIVEVKTPAGPMQFKITAISK
ncbi:MAG: transcription elongation factor GreA [Clostridia bacterium]|nr:transcription elongation factor GreA [Clostridia bacterium]